MKVPKRAAGPANHTHETETEFNRRDFLKGGSVAAVMTMLGGS